MSEAHASTLAHHFESHEQQHEAATLGMWAFLVQEVMFFGGLFATYLVYRTMYPEVFVAGSNHLSWGLGTFNTVVLIASHRSELDAVAQVVLPARVAAGFGVHPDEA